MLADAFEHVSCAADVKSTSSPAIAALKGMAELTEDEPRTRSSKGELAAEGWSPNFIAETAFRS